ncbi:hypothetical protein FBX98_105292 [Burkholderia sp. SJZ115]|nr:hypothetical protein FB600_105115 [Burkholderia sp. SJZ089]TWD04228.1 hypothetical protein FBX98_105292 [Burkholderia sp. SJZ115]TWD09364.1 hypothetical protein FB601_104115 [Burkholderia sp. SJZ091]
MSINDSPSLHPAHSANHESSPARRTLLKSLVAGGAAIAFGARAHAAAASHIASIPGIVDREGLYQVRFSQKHLWPENEGAPSDTLQLEIFEKMKNIASTVTIGCMLPISDITPAGMPCPTVQ